MRTVSGICYNHEMGKQQNKSTNNRYKWMRDKDLRVSILGLALLMLLLSIVVLYILTKVDPQGFVLLFSPVGYVVNLFRQATPGEKLTILYLPVGGVIGWFLNQLFSKKQ
ncbi:MAG TPA: hypothetical protein VEP90_16720 [Methylomirabilota bacterium]|nr:hypothetical protein [Methylomirabilota bacterium]